MKDRGNPDARQRLINIYLRTALKIALFMTKQYGLDIEDTVFVSIIGLIEAVDSYEHYKTPSFYSYMSRLVWKKIQRCCKPVWFDYYLTYRDRRELFLVYRLYKELTQESNVLESDKTRLSGIIATELEMAVEKVAEYIVLIQSKKINLDELIDLLESNDMEYPDSLTVNVDYDTMTEAARLSEMLGTLTERDQKVIRKFYDLDGKHWTLEEIADFHNVTPMRILVV